MKTWMLIFGLLAGPNAFSANHSYESYDDIVDKLSRYNDGSVIERKRYKPLHTRAHAGMGLSQTFFQSSSSDGDQNGLEHGGLMLSLGMDVFSSRWGIEGSFQNFGRSQGATSQYQLREWNMKAFYKPQIGLDWFLRVGGGVSSRFLKVKNLDTQAEREWNTPSLSLTLGVDTYLTRMLSFGADLNYKNALIQDTIDSQSIDVSFRIDTHF